MIRINLIPGERRAAKGPARTFDLAQKITVAGSLILLVTALLVGWRYWMLDQRERQLGSDIESARREEQRLGEVLKQVAAFEAQRAQLQERVTLIDELRRGQSAPVHMVDQISRSLPEMTWLTTLKQEGYDVTIQGRSTTLAALSDFVGNLEATRYFRKPVEIVESEVVKGQNDGPDLIQFTIKGTFHMAGIEPPATATATGKGGAKATSAKGGKVG
jgi:type IV pilus assembly protein PilN